VPAGTGASQAAKTPGALWNNSPDSTTIADPDCDESVENTPNIYGRSLANRYGDNSAMYSMLSMPPALGTEARTLTAQRLSYYCLKMIPERRT